jgi:3-methylcrotonyl-CoA carboxylase alpha subunit
MRQEDIRLRGHAIEARIYAEDPVSFLPQIGPVHEIVVPEGPGIRNDGGLQSGDEVSIHYDPMIAKLSVYAPDRAGAIGRMRSALDDYGVLGLTTNLTLLRAIVADPRFIAGETHTSFLDEGGQLSNTHGSTPPEILVAAALAITPQSPPGSDPFAGLWRAGGTVRRLRLAARDGTIHTVGLRDDPHDIEAQIDEEPHRVEVISHHGSTLTLRLDSHQERFLVDTSGATIQVQWRGTQYVLRRQDGLSVDQLGGSGASVHGNANLEAPMSGTIIKVLVEEGQAVVAGESLVVLEAMKMEHTITAPDAGTIGRIHFRSGQLAPGGAVLVEMR